jgi:hypothetical protein
MLKIKMACGFAAMVCALAAFASPSFAFKQFKGGEGKVAKSSEQVFAVSSGVEVKCASVTGSAAIERGNTAQVKTKQIKYENCTLVNQPATVTGCSYNFHINEKVTVEGNSCTVTSTTCVLKIVNLENKELTAVNYTDTGKGATISSELKANVAGITASGSVGICAGLKTKAATYKGTIGIEGIGVA